MLIQLHVTVMVQFTIKDGDSRHKNEILRSLKEVFFILSREDMVGIEM